MAAPILALAPPAHADVSVGIGINIGIPPPALPVYAQPMIPGPGYIWTPGYWAWDPAYAGYYWVPGTWVMPPAIGLLWTPGWWGWSDGYYRWNAGYWGTRVGFYGGINYGFGYFGTGYTGGYWRGNNFFYNRAVNNVNVTNIRNVYIDRTVINNVNVNRVSYNGGRGGIRARPSAAQMSYANQRRTQPTSMQTQQRETAMRNPAQRFTANRGRPAVFATQRAGDFAGQHAVRQPAPRGSRMIAAPQRAASPVVNREHGFVEAPRDRATPAQRQQPTMRPQRAAPQRGGGFEQAPQNRPPMQRARQPAERSEPTRGNGFMQAPRERPQPMQAEPRPYEGERMAPPNERPGEPGMREPAARGGRAPQARPARSQKQAPERRAKHDDNGH